jgi:Cu2+-exporting ATPase
MSSPAHGNEPHVNAAHHPHHAGSVSCSCGQPCLSCQAAVLATTSGCEFEAKQFEYGIADATRAHAHHVAGHGMGEAHDHEAMMADPRMAAFMEADMRRRFLWSLMLTIPAVLYSPLGQTLLRLRLPEPISGNWIQFLLTTPVVFWTGSIFITGAYRSLRNRALNMSVLISVGVLAAYLFSVVITVLNAGEAFYEAAVMLVTFVLFGHWMEMRSRHGTSDALQALFNLVPPKARVVRNGQVVEIPTAEIQRDDLVELRPGDRVPVDGIVADGETAIDESLVTGESIPVAKRPGDPVVGGSINQSGSVRFKATKVGEETALAQIVKLVEAAQSSKAPGQRIADRWAQYLVILAVGAGVVTFGIWFGLMRESLLLSLTFAISAIVIACPDALGLATPTAVAVGTGIGARHNFLIKNAATLEQVSRLTAVVMDKTGTLTEGRPRLTDAEGVTGFGPEDVLRFAAAEARSGHPLSKAVLEEAERRKIAADGAVTGFENLAGHGVQATVSGRRIIVGTAKLMRDRGIDLAPVQAHVERLLAGGKTIMLVAVDGRIAGGDGRRRSDPGDIAPRGGGAWASRDRGGDDHGGQPADRRGGGGAARHRAGVRGGAAGAEGRLREAVAARGEVCRDGRGRGERCARAGAGGHRDRHRRRDGRGDRDRGRRADAVRPRGRPAGYLPLEGDRGQDAAESLLGVVL